LIIVTMMISVTLISVCCHAEVVPTQYICALSQGVPITTDSSPKYEQGKGVTLDHICKYTKEN